MHAHMMGFLHQFLSSKFTCKALASLGSTVEQAHLRCCICDRQFGQIFVVGLLVKFLLLNLLIVSVEKKMCSEVFVINIPWMSIDMYNRYMYCVISLSIFSILQHVQLMCNGTKSMYFMLPCNNWSNLEQGL